MQKKIKVKKVIAEEILIDSELDEFGRADIMAEFILADGKEAILFVEAKVDSKKGENQLDNYDAYLKSVKGKKKVFKVFLTLEKQNKKTFNKGWINLTFPEVLRCLEEVLSELPDSMEKSYLAFFAASILKDSMDVKHSPNENQYSKYKTYLYLKSLGKNKS